MDEMSLVGRAVPDEEDNDLERDRPFNAYRYASSSEAKAIVSEAISLILTYEAHFALKKNKRRATDQAVFDKTVEAVLSDLMHHKALEYPCGIYISRSNRVLGSKSRYRPPVYSKQFRHVLDLLARPEMDYVRQDIAPADEGHRRSTVIIPGGRLIDRMDEHVIQACDLDEHPHSETIVLKRTKDEDNYWDEGGLEEYDDDEVTQRYRSEMEGINQWLATADLQVDRASMMMRPTPFDIRARRLRRFFTRGSFQSGGRLFGGFWQELRKTERRRVLRINGEKAVELDYGQAGVRILYGMAGQTPPEGDLYAFPGYYQQRAGIKRVMSSMSFATGRLDRFPKHTRVLFRKSDKIDEVVAEIERWHPLVRNQFYKGLGHEVQFVESQIMIEVLRTLKGEQVVALPIHDATMVPASAVHPSKEIMLEVFHRLSGVKGIVTEEKE
ncbi:MAG: hypothetical protein IBJ07_05895 [Rhizobiaceae bacterium]|nr:hypothetical protein [Rhizobiaceae bacterium]